MNQSAEPLTLFPGDSRVSRSLMPGSAEAREMTVISGRKCFASFESLDRGGSWRKTFLACFLSTPAWYSRLCFLTWSVKATKHSRLYIRLQASAPRTKETGFSLLPTVKTSDMYNPASTDGTKRGRTLRSVGMWPTASTRDWKDTPGMAVEGTTPDGTLRKREDQLARAVYARMWPTPRSADGEKGIRTPEGAARERERRKNGLDLPSEAGGKLNPTWVEWLMNFPEGWTEVDK